MIGWLKGQVKHIAKELVLLDVGGVGYELYTSLHTLKNTHPGSTVELEVYTYVKENVLRLYGFSTKTEKNMFLLLTGIKGLGPKKALQILSGAFSIEELIVHIETGDVKSLSRLPKIGPKMAKQMLELKDKLGSKGLLTTNDTKDKPTVPSVSRYSLFSALSGLGFKAEEINEALGRFQPEGKDIQKDIKKALSFLHPL